MFVHKMSDPDSGQEACGRLHETVAEARECEQDLLEMLAEPASCPVCDAYGCGANGGGCRRYEWGSEADRFEDEQERMWAA